MKKPSYSEAWATCQGGSRNHCGRSDAGQRLTREGAKTEEAIAKTGLF